MGEVDIDSRIDAIISLLTRLAAGELSARGEMSEAADEIDAIVTGVNMLAEELQANRDEMESRVLQRTVELQELNIDITRLTALGNLLQACDTVDEALDAMKVSLTSLFAGLSGVVYLYRASRNVLEPKVMWGRVSEVHPLLPQDCWGLRRGQPHSVTALNPSLICRHQKQHTGNGICVPMSAHGETSGLLHLTDDSSMPTTSGRLAGTLTAAKTSLASAVSEQSALALANLELRETLRLQAVRDPLTGLLNRRFVDEWIGREVGRTDQSGRSFGVIMADIDHFKQVNDMHGHDAGDQMLKAVAEAIRSSLRPGDLPCRYGGEEFLLLLADVNEQVLLERAEQVRVRIANLQIPHRGGTLLNVTLSAGIALYPRHGATASAVIDAADNALYAAKRGGRNRTALAQRPPLD
ncbi:sensor domain-containing diguanylate cyclase [Nakamurella sp. PAMC28650]|uniref:sensor domain-containing diguanylate cyclase n=1 Tax=Nakamurella sp. PAMC28650 TaxID=2762325 RepID=UPI00164DD32A|nr:GGDEF domain-containing protein [Nakamurella sp. PAMC28650]QNK82069.1 GGDEF domain-containing protein [Nakamurella sp. PAMC28650]